MLRQTQLNNKSVFWFVLFLLDLIVRKPAKTMKCIHGDVFSVLTEIIAFSIFAS